MPYHATPWQSYDVAVGLVPQCLGQASGHIVFQDDNV